MTTATDILAAQLIELDYAHERDQRIIKALSEALEDCKRHHAHYITKLEGRQTGRDPKLNMVIEARVPDWAIAQQINAINAALTLAKETL